MGPWTSLELSSPCHGEDQGFKSPRARLFSQEIRGSNPLARAISTWYHAMPRPQKPPFNLGGFLIGLLNMKFGQRTFSALSVRNYRLYFIGQTISMSGTRMQFVCQSWLVLLITKSAIALGLTAALQWLPILVFGAWGGVFVDRFSKRKILCFTQLASGILALILGIVVIFGWVKIWMVYVLAVALGLVNVIDGPAGQTFVVEMVNKEKLSNAIALNSIETNIARVLGPALAGFLIVYVGLGFCFLINAFSYVAVAIAILMMRANELYISPLVRTAKGQLQEGLKYAKSSPVIRDVLLMGAIVGALACEFAVSLPLLAKFTFNGDAGTYAILVSAMGAGSIIGGLVLAGRRKINTYVFSIITFLFGFFILLAAAMPTLFLTILLLTVVGFFHIYFSSLGNIILQLESDPKMRGRIMALWLVAYSGSVLIGAPIVGWICQYSGPRWGLAFGGFAAIIAAGIGLKNLKAAKIRPYAGKELLSYEEEIL